MDRVACRKCDSPWVPQSREPSGGFGGSPPKAAKAANVVGSSQQGGWEQGAADTKHPRPPTKVHYLEAALAAAMAAEAPSSVTDGIRQQLDSAHAQAAAAKPIGARLDSAHAKVTRATKAVEAAQEALRMAEASLIASRQAKDAADKELSELQAVARAAPPEKPMPGPHPELAQGVRRLLDVLEQSRLIDMTTNTVPEQMLAEMQSLHSLLATTAEAPSNTAEDVMDLDTQAAGVAAGEKRDAAEALLGELGGEDADDAALGARVKQRLREAAQRRGPY